MWPTTKTTTRCCVVHAAGIHFLEWNVFFVISWQQHELNSLNSLHLWLLGENILNETVRTVATVIDASQLLAPSGVHQRLRGNDKERRHTYRNAFKLLKEIYKIATDGNYVEMAKKETIDWRLTYRKYQIDRHGDRLLLSTRCRLITPGRLIYCLSLCTALSSVLFSISQCNRLYIHYIVYIPFRFLFRSFFLFF
jgi:hypothetical protein